jgi:hypothetical protein
MAASDLDLPTPLLDLSTVATPANLRDAKPVMAPRHQDCAAPRGTAGNFNRFDDEVAIALADRESTPVFTDSLSKMPTFDFWMGRSNSLG